MDSFLDLAGVLIAELILAMGVVAICLSPRRGPWLGRTAFWFGITACMYGMRLASQSRLVQPFGPEAFWRHLDATVTYLIIVPIGLFVDSLFGPGWKSLLRRVWQVGLGYALGSIAWDAAHHQPGAALWLNRPLIILAGGLVMGHLLWHWRRAKASRELRIAGTGGLLFLCVATYQTLDGRYQVEPFAMLIFVGSVGYLVAHRMLEGERRLVVVARELELAGRIQHSILPRELPKVPGLDFAAGYFPCGEIGGDFYDFQVLDGRGLGLIVADVSGHGIPAALVASMVKIAFAAEAEGMAQPGHTLTRINQVLCGKFSGVFVTACCAFLDPTRGILRYACAGHPGPWLLRRVGGPEQLQLNGLLLAFDPQARFEASEVTLAAGDRLAFSSDGLLEASDAKGACFGDQVFPGLLTEGRSLATQAFLEQTMGALRSWIGQDAPLQDDVTLVLVDVLDGT